MATAVPITAILEKKPLTFRHELKHTINHGDDYILTQRLRKLFPHDRNADSHGSYRVSSLYFDTPFDTALRQKVDGADRREKFRLRYYGTDTGFIRLEKKIKQRGLCGKLSAPLTREQTQRILDGDCSFLSESGHPLLTEFYSKLRGQLLSPKAIVIYDREAFVYTPGNVRITIDRNVRAGVGTTHFLDPHRCHLPVSDGLSVLEVKYDAFLPQLVAMAVQVPNRQAGAYSKYAQCRRYE